LFNLRVEDGLKLSKDIVEKQKFTYALAYSPNGLLSATGNIDGAV